MMPKNLEDQFDELMKTVDEKDLKDIHTRINPFTDATCELIESFKGRLRPQEIVAFLIWDATLISINSASTRENGIEFIRKALELSIHAMKEI
jgi:hypothetical protein